MKDKIIYYVTSVIATLIIFYNLGLNVSQLIASTTVAAIILGTIFFLENRVAIALLGVTILFITGLLSIDNFLESSRLDLIIFLASMMIFVAFLEKNLFFEVLVKKTIEKIGGGKRLFIILMLLTALFAALVDEVTSILFMLGIIFYLCNKLKINPIPLVIITIFITNIGSSATVIGNPVGIMIALSSGLSISNFFKHATIPTIIILIVALITAYFVFRKEIKEFTTKSKNLKQEELIITNKPDVRMLVNSILFVIIITGIFFHGRIEVMFGLQRNAALIGFALLAAGISLLLEKTSARQFVEDNVDWATLLFFMLLFVSIGALEQTNVMQLLSQTFTTIFASNKIMLMIGVMLIAGLLSAILDNILAVALFIPLIQNLHSLPIGGDYLWWTLLFGSTLFGNLTMIGSTANIVAIGLVEKHGLQKINFKQWIKYALPIVITTTITAFILTYLF